MTPRETEIVFVVAYVATAITPTGYPNEGDVALAADLVTWILDRGWEPMGLACINCGYIHEGKS